MFRVHRLKSGLRRFGSDEKGSIAVEAVIILPMMFWTFLALFAAFHSYRTYSINQKAAYTIADMLSRETAKVDSAYIDGAVELLAYLTNAPSEDVAMRVTSVTYNSTSESYEAVWSEGRGGLDAVETEDVAAWTNRLPKMPDDDFVIVVETFHDYDPPFNTGLTDRTIRNFIFTRPRYAPSVRFDDGSDGGGGNDSTFN